VSRLAEALRQAEGSSIAEHDVAAPDTIVPGLADRGDPSHGSQHADEDRAIDIAPHKFSPNATGKLVVMPAVPAAAVEQYRRLAAALHHTQLERETKVLMVTSASPGEGKTLTATNLALTLSESYRREVLLIDADLRRPSIHQMFQIPNVLGLNDGLMSETEQKLSLIQVSEHLTVLPAGRPDNDPMGGLTSDRMRRIVQEAASRYDWVVIDTPPVGFLSDANLLVAMVDVAIFVVRAGKSPYRLIQRALDAVGRNRILGVVLNAVEENVDQAGYYYYGYYGTPRRRLGK
jgi:capsular exopolysaccharide synthesis family protein